MNLITVSGVNGYVDENGTAWLNIEHVARGLGFTQEKDGVEYIRWVTVHGHLDSIGFSQQVGKEGFIPENIFYLLAMKASNQTAVSFQMKVANEILPSIRKTGSYSLQPYKMPTSFPEALRMLADAEEEKLLLLPKAEAFDTFIDAKNSQNMNIVAKSLGIGRNKLFAFLREQKVLLSNNTPYQEYLDRGYFEVKEKPVAMGDSQFNKPQTYVFPKGVAYIERLLNERKVSA
ncbi:MAG: phage antirepressor KilAC domain-containing protein [Bacillota bacterium]|nr:phage antirepressor KilAC domain-containing protein [Bacillota bacterium]